MKLLDLEKAIIILDTLYANAALCVLPDDLGAKLGFENGEEVPDLTYDKMRRDLELIRPNSDVFTNVTASLEEITEEKANEIHPEFFALVRGILDDAVKKVKHDPPLSSISKACHEERSIQEGMLFKWLMDCTNAAPSDVSGGGVYDLDEKEIDGVLHKARIYNEEIVTYPRGYFCQSYKLDGAALALYYEKGMLVAAGLRPRNGVDGEDVTEQVRYVKGIPQKLNQSVTCSIRGELICHLSDFEKVQIEREAEGLPLRANPRNHAAGGIRQFKDPSKVKQQRLSFIAYCIEGMENPPYKSETERAKYCAKKLGVPHVQVRPFNFYDLDMMEANVKNLDYEVDGVVICVDCFEDQEQLGKHGDRPNGNPRGKIAWKFAEERKVARVKEIEWNTGRLGSITPVAIFEKVELAGTQVGRATLHNLGFMQRNKIGIGTEVILLKSGKIIPKVVGVAGNPDENPNFPSTCPSCGEPTEVVINKNCPNTVELLCNNEDCGSRKISSFAHYFSIMGVLGIGDSRIEALVYGGKVKDFVDFYKLTLDDIMSCDLSQRQALLVLSAIHMVPNPSKTKENKVLMLKVEKAQSSKKVVPAWQLFAAFGIPTAGRSVGRTLVGELGSFGAIRNSNPAELEKLEGVGSKTAEIICQYLTKHAHEIDDLLNFVTPESPKVGPLTGKQFVFTGGFPGGKKLWQKRVQDLGGAIGNNVSAKTDFVVEGIDAGSKAEKAKKYNIPLISVDELKKNYL